MAAGRRGGGEIVIFILIIGVFIYAPVVPLKIRTALVDAWHTIGLSASRGIRFLEAMNKPDANGLFPENYDKNGWAIDVNGNRVHRSAGEKAVSHEPVSTIVLTPANYQINAANKTLDTITISNDGYIYYDGYRLKPNASYKDYTLLTGNAALDRLAQQLRGKTDYDTLFNIYKWVTGNIAYDTSYSMADSAIDPVLTYNKRKGVCSDYAALYAYLAEKNGIDVYYIVSENHGWIETIYNGERLYIDPTWGAGYVKKNTFSKKYDPAWFSAIPLSQVEINTGLPAGGFHNKTTSTEVYIVD